MSFIATAAGAPAPPASNTVTNDGFFPDIDLERVRGAVRLDGTVTAQRLREAVVTAVIALNDEFATWKAAQQLAGVASLSELPPKIDGASRQLTLYLVAVHRTVRADLSEKYRGFDSTKSGLDAAECADLVADDERGAARRAVRAFLGLSNTTIELI
jgi:hypothetical protein